jgi:hypothetical protein
VEGHVEIWKLLSNCADDAGRPDLGFGVWSWPKRDGKQGRSRRLVNSFKNGTTTRKPRSGRLGQVQGVVDLLTDGRKSVKLADSNDGI